MMKLTVLLGVCGMLMSLASAQQAPCSKAEFRQFDFWLGQWDVFDKKGQKVGENSIELHHNQCVISEVYTTEKGFSGRSVNIFNRQKNQWHQTWADSSGALLLLEGEWNGQAMVLLGETEDQQGNKVLQRIKWTPKSDGTVHQQWMSSNDRGQHWDSIFYGVYIRKSEPEKSEEH